MEKAKLQKKCSALKRLTDYRAYFKLIKGRIIERCERK